MDNETLRQAIERFEAAREPRALIDTFVETLRPFGAIGFTAADHSIDDRSDLLLYTSMEDVFGPMDSESPWWSDDPVVARLASGVMRPFDVEDAWAEALPSAAPRWEVLTQMRLNRGWVFPTSKPGYIGGVHVFLDPDDHARMRNHLDTAHLVCTYFHAFITELDPDPDNQGIVRNTLKHRPKADRRFKLSPREIDCLRWCAFGKTADETAAIESISVHTVRDYLKSAQRKLDSRSQAQAVARAIKYGLFRT